jgi:hypothetical protein
VRSAVSRHLDWEVGDTPHIDVVLDDHEFAEAASRAQVAGISLEAWVHDLIRATVSPYPVDPLFGVLADQPELVDAIDAVVAERGSRRVYSAL